jgi:hypothetical protein
MFTYYIVHFGGYRENKKTSIQSQKASSLFPSFPVSVGAVIPFEPVPGVDKSDTPAWTPASHDANSVLDFRLSAQLTVKPQETTL